MEQNYFDPAHFYKTGRSGIGCAVPIRKSDINPKCIDDDFCTEHPQSRNNGILAMAFVDMQPLQSVYPQETAFCNGTLFPNLNMPFYGGNCK